MTRCVGLDLDGWFALPLHCALSVACRRTCVRAPWGLRRLGPRRSRVVDLESLEVEQSWNDICSVQTAGW